ncbi:hypothetical protein BN1723_000209 [Verticillium longisporum]|nr:hypothetical protein BN1723_000209 [Verticillium longisporum]
MSKDEGATAKNSILLAYPYDFVGTVPIKAARRRHWPTFLAGTVMVIIFWLITPLQSAIMGTGIVSVKRDMAFSTNTQFEPIVEHEYLLDQSVLNEGYAITWLNQPLPPFTAPDYTVLPFYPSRNISLTNAANWTGITTKYSTALNCWPAQAAQQGPASRRTFYFDNGRGCNVSDIVPHPSSGGATPFKMLYFGYQGSPYADYALGTPTCSSNSTHQFLATWSTFQNFNKSIDDIHLEAIFCETNYHKQKVQVTITTDQLAPVSQSIIPLESPQPLSATEFNVSSFEYLLGAGVSAVELFVQREHPFGRVLEQLPKIKDLGLTWPMSPMVGFAVGSQKVTNMNELNNQTGLAEAYNSTHQLMFSLALRRLLLNATTSSISDGTVIFDLHGVIVSRLFSAVVEGLLCLVAVLTLLLCWTSSIAPCNLTRDPASLGDLIRICRNSLPLLEQFAGKDCLTEDDMTATFPQQRFRLVCGCRTRSGEMKIKILDDTGDRDASVIILGQEDALSLTRGHYSPVRPYVMRRDFGLMFILVMITAIVGLAVLKSKEKADGGLAQPDASFEVLKILLNYLPTVFATLLEPMWVLLNRLMCMIQPFKDLWSGSRPAKGSINARYTSVPPQLVFWRALGARHFLLATVCFVALMSNLLAVGLSGIFNQLPVKTFQPRSFEQTLLPRLINKTMYSLDVPWNTRAISYEEPFYVAMNNLSQGTPLPPWHNHEYFFQPFTIDAKKDETKVETYKARTRGLGVVPTCRSGGSFTSKGDGPVLQNVNSLKDMLAFDCPETYQPGALDTNKEMYTLPSGRSSAEVVDTVTQNFTLEGCDVTFILGWSRSSEVEAGDGRMETSFAMCRPVFTTAMFDLTVDTEGYVLEADRVSEHEEDLGYPDSIKHVESMIIVLNHLLRDNQMHWHNDTVSRDWFNYLIKIQPGFEDLLDPQTPVPNPDDLIPTIESLYRQLYALLLGLNDNIFERSEKPAIIEGTRQQTEVRIFIPLAAFIISIAVLSLNILTAVVLYTHGVKFFLPRMPTTVGSVLAYVAPSRAVSEYHDGGVALNKSTTFSFGRYIGVDGRAHVGIEIDPFVVPVKLSSLRKGETQPSSLLRRTFTRKSTSESGDTWL